MANVALIIFASITIILLFGVMILNAYAAYDAHNEPALKCKQTCGKWSTYAAIVCGFAIACMILLLVLYIYSRPGTKENLATAQHHMNRAQQQLQDYIRSLQAQQNVSQGVPQGVPSVQSVAQSMNPSPPMSAYATPPSSFSG